MASWCRVLPAIALIALVGCGDDALPGCDPEVTCQASSTSDVTGSDGGDTTTGDDTTTSAASTDGDSTGIAPTTAASSDTGVDDSSDTGASDSGSGDSTGAPDDAEYRAVAIIGGLDRIRIFKRNLVTDHCTWITLVLPGSPSEFDVETPEGWAVESIAISDAGEACDSDSPDMFGAETATAAMGSIEFGDPGDVYPCLVSPDVEAGFAGVLPGIPPTDTLAASDIPVDGC